MIIERRALLRGLFATPAIVAVGSLMPIRGLELIGSWNAGAEMNGVYYKTIKDAADAAVRAFDLWDGVSPRPPTPALIKVLRDEIMEYPRFNWPKAKHFESKDTLTVLGPQDTLAAIAEKHKAKGLHSFSLRIDMNGWEVK